jgi:hypothetical protein
LLAGGSASIAQARFERLGSTFNIFPGTPATTLTLSNSTVGSGNCLAFLSGAGSTTATISGSTFNGCSSPALSVSSGTINVSSSIIRDTTNTTAAVNVSGGTVTIDRSTLSYNAGIGVLSNCGTSGSIAVTNSIVSHNGDVGLRRYTFCGTNPSLSASGNVVWGNSGTHAAGTATAGANSAANNYTDVAAGAGSFSANPLFLNGAMRNLRITHRSVARRPSGTDIGALPFAGDNTPGTGLQGYLWANETLSGAVPVSGDVFIPSGVTITVDPGTTFTFAASDTLGSGDSSTAAELFISGSLQAIGTAPSQIVFTGSGTTSTWGGVRLLAGGSASIAQARFQRMASTFNVFPGTPATTLTLSNSTVGSGNCLAFLSGTGSTTATISGSTFNGCSSPALSISSGAVTVTSTVIRDTTNTTAAVNVSGGTVTIDRSTLSYNAGIGVLSNCGTSGAIAVTNSIVSHNGDVGLRRYTFCGTNPSLSASYNDVWGNSGTGQLMPPTGASTPANNYTDVAAGAGSQSANPLFTNGAMRDLTLTSTSPCIGAGRVGAVPGGMVIDQGAFPFTVGPIATVVVFPVNPTVAAGGTIAFGATALDSNNNPVATTFTWSATASAGSITPTGTLTASCTPGTITNGVSATAPNGVVGRTNVTITLGAANNIAITPAAPMVRSQGTQQFTAAVRDSCNNPLPGAMVTWSATPQAGSITPAGLFTASCTRGLYANAVTATSGAITGRTDVTVGPGDVAAISLNPTNPTVTAGATQLFAATAADGCGNTVMNAPITWSTTAPGSSISMAGIFTAGQSNGTFPNSVTAATPGGTGTVSASTGVTITGGTGGSVASITISPASPSLAVGATQQFTATALNAMGQVVPGAPIAWSVVNGGGSISMAGLFTAGNVAGSFANTVRASSGTASATVSVTVTPGPVATVAVTPAAATLAPGGMTTFTAQARDSFNNVVPSTFTWSATPAAGTITQGGAFTASSTLGTYNAAVTATVGTVSGTANVTIQAGALASLTIAPPLAMVQAGGTSGFTVTGRDSMGTVVPVTPTWSVVSGGGTINASGIFTAGTMAGTFANTVRAEANGLTAFASVQVQPGPVLSVVVTPSSATLAAGATQQFTAEARDAFMNAVPVGFTWASQPAAGTITAGGFFTAGATAGAFPNAVTATAGGVNGFANVTVTGGMTGGGMAGGGAAGGGMAGGGMAGGGMAGGGAAGGGMAGGGAAGGGMAGGGAAGGGDAGGSAGGGDAGGSAGGGMAGGSAMGGGTGAAGGSAVGGGSGTAGGTAGGGTGSAPGSGCGCSSADAFAPFALLGLLGALRRRRAQGSPVGR